jgi:hypothetical protein
MARWRIAGVIATGSAIRFRSEMMGADATLGSLLRRLSRLTLVGDSISRSGCKPLGVSVAQKLRASTSRPTASAACWASA